MKENYDNCYASPHTKILLAKETGLTVKQVTKWLVNQRFRKKNRSTLSDNQT